MPSKEVKALAKRIQDEFDIPVDPCKFYRTYVGYHQRAAGECTWVIYTSSVIGVVGGFEPIRKYITKKNKLAISQRRFGEYELYAICPGEPGYEESEEQPEKFIDGIITFEFTE